MTYSVKLSKKADKQLSKLPIEIQKRITLTFERIKFRPHYFVKRKAGTSYYLLRIGEHRAILDIVNKELIIHVIEVGPRKNIYDNRN